MLGNLIKMSQAYKFTELMNDNLKNTFRFLGENKNSATIIACSIAVFKGIFRPMFTMMDKKSDPETKKYAAIREGLTEVAALPLYAATPWAVGKMVEKFSKETNEIVKDRMKMNAKFAGICVATLIIPAVCNVIQPPVMKAYKQHQDAKKTKMGLDVISDSNIKIPPAVNKPATPVNSSLLKTLPSTNSGMRVGN